MSGITEGRDGLMFPKFVFKKFKKSFQRSHQIDGEKWLFLIFPQNFKTRWLGAHYNDVTREGLEIDMLLEKFIIVVKMKLSLPI